MNYKLLKYKLSSLFQYFITSKLLYILLVKKFIKDDFIKLKQGYISVFHRSHFVKSLLFFGFYERKEQQVIANYLLKDNTIVELGASIGVITSLLCRMTNKSVYAVEANPLLQKNLELTKQKNNFSSLTIISSAISYTSSDFINFSIDENNLGSKVAPIGEKVRTLTLHLLLTSYQIKDYILVADIEGAELELFLLETHHEVIRNCKQIIIELHDAEYNGVKYSKTDIAELIQQNFKMKYIFHYSDIWVFSR